jgi:hypothetical protein
MNRRVIFVVLFFLVSFFFFAVSQISAAPSACGTNYPGFSVEGNFPSQVIMGAPYAPVKMLINNVPLGNYKVSCSTDGGATDGWGILGYTDMFQTTLAATPNGNGKGLLTWNVSDNQCFKLNSPFDKVDFGAYESGTPCTVQNYSLKASKAKFTCTSDNIILSLQDDKKAQSCFEAGNNVAWQIQNLKFSNGATANGTVLLSTGNGPDSKTQTITVTNGSANGISAISVDAATQEFSIRLSDPDSVQTSDNFGPSYKALCSKSVQVYRPGSCTEADKKTPPKNPAIVKYDFCLQIDGKQTDSSGLNSRDRCQKCLDGSLFGKPVAAGGDPGLWTAVGCIPTTYQGLTSSLIKIGLSIAGGVALLMILSAAFTLTTSQGEPKAATEAKDQLTAAVAGLLFIIFSITILQFIGVSILQLPGFGK